MYVYISIHVKVNKKERKAGGKKLILKFRGTKSHVLLSMKTVSAVSYPFAFRGLFLFFFNLPFCIQMSTLVHAWVSPDTTGTGRLF